jgi:hypothetical protein
MRPYSCLTCLTRLCPCHPWVIPTTDRPTEGITTMLQALFALLFGQFAGGLTDAVSWER